MPVSTTPTANSKISCSLVLQWFQEGRLWACVTINIDESEYKKPVANIKKWFGHFCRQHTDEIWDWVIRSLIFAQLEDHKHFNRTQFSFIGHSDTSLLPISRSDFLQPEVMMQFCCRDWTHSATVPEVWWIVMITAESEMASLDEIGESLPSSYAGRLKPSKLQPVRAQGAPAQRCQTDPSALALAPSWKGSV